MSGVNVRVVARFRPADKKQQEMQNAFASKQGKKAADTAAGKKNLDSPFQIDFSGGTGTVTVVAPPDENKNLKEGGIGLAGSGDRSVKHNFSFDDVLSSECTQEDVYATVAQGGVDDILKGYNCTVFAYGQTGSGKSHSMFGPKGRPDLAGIIPRAARGIFAGISAATDIDEVNIKCMFLEIYREAIRDLLNPAGGVKLKVREKNGDVVIEGLREEYVTSADDILEVVQLGEKSRSVTATDMNEVSSRSHSLLIVILTQNMKDGTQRVSRLNLVDLAGSERIAKTHATGQTLEEAKMINQSLSSLGNCINALTTAGRTHIPFRDSMLTYLLKDSLGGNTKTTLLVCCSSEAFNCDETVSTLLFAKRAKKIKNKAMINTQLSNAQLMALVIALKKKLSISNVTIRGLEQMIRDFMSGKLDPKDPACVKMLQSLLAANNTSADDDDEDIVEEPLRPSQQAAAAAVAESKQTSTPENKPTSTEIKSASEGKAVPPPPLEKKSSGSVVSLASPTGADSAYTASATTPVLGPKGGKPPPPPIEGAAVKSKPPLPSSPPPPPGGPQAPPSSPQAPPAAGKTTPPSVDLNPDSNDPESSTVEFGPFRGLPLDSQNPFLTEAEASSSAAPLLPGFADVMMDNPFENDALGDFAGISIEDLADVKKEGQINTYAEMAQLRQQLLGLLSKKNISPASVSSKDNAALADAFVEADPLGVIKANPNAKITELDLRMQQIKDLKREKIILEKRVQELTEKGMQYYRMREREQNKDAANSGPRVVVPYSDKCPKCNKVYSTIKPKNRKTQCPVCSTFCCVDCCSSKRMLGDGKSKNVCSACAVVLPATHVDNKRNILSTLVHGGHTVAAKQEPAGSVIQSGYLMKTSTLGDFKKRWIQLLTDRVRYFKEGAEQGTAVGEIVFIRGCNVVIAAAAARPNAFSLIMPGGKTYTFAAENEQSMGGWMEDFRACISAADAMARQRDNEVRNIQNTIAARTAPTVAVPIPEKKRQEADDNGVYYQGFCSVLVEGTQQWNDRILVLREANDNATYLTSYIHDFNTNERMPTTTIECTYELSLQSTSVVSSTVTGLELRNLAIQGGGPVSRLRINCLNTNEATLWLELLKSHTSAEGQ